MLFHLLPGSAWADGNLAELAEQVGKMVEHHNPTQLSDQMDHPVLIDYFHLGTLSDYWYYNVYLNAEHAGRGGGRSRRPEAAESGGARHDEAAKDEDTGAPEPAF